MKDSDEKEDNDIVVVVDPLLFEECWSDQSCQLSTFLLLVYDTLPYAKREFGLIFSE